MDLLWEGSVGEAGCVQLTRGAGPAQGTGGWHRGHLARGGVQGSSSPLMGSPSTRSWEKSPLITVAINVYGATVLGGAGHNVEPQGAQQTHTV